MTNVVWDFLHLEESKVELIFSKKEEDEPRLKVKLTTSSYRTKSGYIQQKSLYFYKTPNPEHLLDCFLEHADHLGMYSIDNLHLLDSGVYELKCVAGPTDYFTGCVEDWDYELIPWRD